MNRTYEAFENRGNTTERIRGVVTGIHPPKKTDEGMKGGYIWIVGEDNVDYFGHITQIEPGVDIFDLRLDQECTFTPAAGSEGKPAAERIKFSNAA